MRRLLPRLAPLVFCLVWFRNIANFIRQDADQLERPEAERLNKRFFSDFLTMLPMNAVGQASKSYFIDLEKRHYIDRQVIGVKTQMKSVVRGSDIAILTDRFTPGCMRYFASSGYVNT